MTTRAAVQTAPRRNPAPTAQRVQVTLATARDLGLSSTTMARSLKAGSPLVKGLADEIALLESEVGDANGVVAPRDLDELGPGASEVMKAVYAITGKKPLSVAAIAKTLPDALVRLFRTGAARSSPVLAEHYRRLTEETVQWLGREYPAAVLEGSASRQEFLFERGLSPNQQGKLQKLLPAALPKPTRTQLISLYRRAYDGDLGPRDLYSRAQLGADDFRQLQKTDPKHFPRPEGLKDRDVLAAAPATQKAPDLGGLASAWADEVLTGALSVHKFGVRHGLNPKQLERLMNEHPDRFPPRGGDIEKSLYNAPLSPLEARRVGERASALFARDALVRLEDVLADINAHLSSVGRTEPLDKSRYMRLRAMAPDRYPDLAAAKPKLLQLHATVAEVLKKEAPASRAELISAVQQTHPRFNLGWLERLREAYPKLVPAFGQAMPLGHEHEDDAQAIAEIWNADPSATAEAVVKAVNRPRVTTDRVYRLLTQRPELFVEAVLQRKRPKNGTDLPAQSLPELVLRSAPPGTAPNELLRVLNEVRAERGLAPVPPSYTWGKIPGLAEWAKVPATTYAAEMADVVAEYLGAAAPDETLDMVLARVRHDYPSAADALESYRQRWLDQPEQFPALKPFFRDGELSPAKSKPAAPRFVGGWNLEHAMAGASADEVRELARLTQLASITRSSVLLDQMVSDLGGARPLDHVQVLRVSHLLGHSWAFTEALEKAGLSTGSTVTVGSPYGSPAVMQEALAAEGYDVRVPKLSVAAYEAQVEQALDDAIANREKRGLASALVVIDDGGLVASVLARHPKKYAQARQYLKIVEQTTGGILLAEKQPIAVPVVNVPATRSKRREGDFIGTTVAEKTMQMLGRAKRTPTGKKAVVMGYGNVGTALAASLKAAGFHVTVVEPGGKNAQRAATDGFHVASAEQALPSADLVIGSTGTPSLPLPLLELLGDGAMFASASSKQVEADMSALAAAASKRTVVEDDNPIASLPTVEYVLHGKRLIAIGDGWPVDFDGDVNVTPPEQMQITDAIMFAAVVQAARMRGPETGLVAVDAEVDEKVLQRFVAFEAKQKGKPTVSDPGRWLDVALGVAKKFTPAKKHVYES